MTDDRLIPDWMSEDLDTCDDGCNAMAIAVANPPKPTPFASQAHYDAWAATVGFDEDQREEWGFEEYLVRKAVSKTKINLRPLQPPKHFEDLSNADELRAKYPDSLKRALTASDEYLRRFGLGRLGANKEREALDILTDPDYQAMLELHIQHYGSNVIATPSRLLGMLKSLRRAKAAL